MSFFSAGSETGNCAIRCLVKRGQKYGTCWSGNCLPPRVYVFFAWWWFIDAYTWTIILSWLSILLTFLGLSYCGCYNLYVGWLRGVKNTYDLVHLLSICKKMFFLRTPHLLAMIFLFTAGSRILAILLVNIEVTSISFLMVI
jgi:hypothetical protein